jgi:hypothetical protein
MPLRRVVAEEVGDVRVEAVERLKARVGVGADEGEAQVDALARLVVVG